MITAFHAKYFAHELTRRFPTDSAEKLTGQKNIKAIEALRNLKRRSLFDAQDQVDQQREELIAAIEGKMNQNTRAEQLFSIRWSIS